MSYEKQTWATNDVITEDKLNHMEDGIENAGGGAETFLISLTFDAEQEMYVTNKTWKEIHDAYIAGKRCVMKNEGSSATAEMEVTYFRASEIESSYKTGTTYWQFEAQSETDYPMGNL